MMPNLKTQAITYPLIGFSALRSAVFAGEHFILRQLASKLLGQDSAINEDFSPEIRAALKQGVMDILQKDAQAIAQGDLPAQLLAGESPVSHLKRLPGLYWDGLMLHRRRKNNKIAHFGQSNPYVTETLPSYYKRNFHFQTDGYLSDQSASLYEHQVEMLFSGTAQAMRRLLLREIVAHRLVTAKKPVKVLELGCGTGAASEQLLKAFPNIELYCLDLSAPYLKRARKRLQRFSNVNFVQGAAEDLPFKDSSFDLVVSVFLFHELPHEVRTKSLAESYRVLRPTGATLHVDSLQKDDQPELNEVLFSFPKSYHEPYYRNYVENPMKEHLKSYDWELFPENTALLSKSFGARRQLV